MKKNIEEYIQTLNIHEAIQSLVIIAGMRGFSREEILKVVEKSYASNNDFSNKDHDKAL